MISIGIIPARGGSKSIPLKNIKLFNGKPLIEYTIESALKSGVLDKIVVSNGFNEKLLSIVKHKKSINIDSKKSIYGFSPLNAAIFSTLCISIIFFSYSLIRPSNVFSTDRSENVNFLNENYKSSINSSLITDDNNLSSSVKEDSLKKSDKKYKVNKANKIKFVNN